MNYMKKKKKKILVLLINFFMSFMFLMSKIIPSSFILSKTLISPAAVRCATMFEQVFDSGSNRHCRK